MSRIEEIQNYAYNNCINDDIDDTSYSLIVETARWADKTLIKRLENWLNDNFGTSYNIDCYGNFTNETEVTSSFDTMEELMESFHKAMEE